MEGWISIHRKLIEASWFKKSEYVHLWLYLLLKANYKDKEVFIGNEKILVKRGQLLTSRNKLSEAVHVQENKIYRILKCFENEHQIEQQKTSRYTVITILNYDIYQKVEQVNEQQMNSKRTADEQPMNTNNNDNNIYIILINKYKGKFSELKTAERIKLFSEIKNSSDYGLLTTEEKENIFYELMGV